MDTQVYVNTQYITIGYCMVTCAEHSLVLQVVLFDLASALSRQDTWRKELWELSHIGVPDSDQESRDAIMFGFLTYWFLKEVSVPCTHTTHTHTAHCIVQFVSRLPGPPPMVVTHFHEWLSGVGLILCRLKKLPVSTVFTTHATLLGRYLCAGNVDFYNNLPNVSQ